MPIPNPSPQARTSFSTRIYLPRVLGLALGGLAVAAALFEQQPRASGLWALLLINALVWPHAAYQLATRAQHPRRAEKINLMIDAALGGLWVVAINGNLLPSVAMIAMLSMNNVATGGLRFFGFGLLANILGALISWALFGWHFTPESSFLVQLACIPFLLGYPLLIGSVTLKLARRLNRQRSEMRWLSENDVLSGIYNRRYIEHRFAEEFENFKRHCASTALAIADLDHFKEINDHYGHPVGDAVIRLVGQVLRHEIRRTDIAARIGGDEFVVLMPFTTTEEAIELIQRLQNGFSAAIAPDPRMAGISLSFGVASPSEEMRSHQHWMERADNALYRAKAQRRGSVEVA